MTQRVPGLKGLLESVIESGDPHVTDELSVDPELKQFISFRACASGYCIPLRAGLDTFGVLLFAHPEKGYFTIEAQETINTIGHQAQLAMQNAHLLAEPGTCSPGETWTRLVKRFTKRKNLPAGLPNKSGICCSLSARWYWIPRA